MALSQSVFLFLSDEKQLSVFGQGPHLVVNHEFEFIDMITYGIEEGLHIVVVGNGAFTAVVDAIGDLTRLDHLIDILNDERLML